MIDWLLIGLGLVILLLAGDALVKGAVNLSLRLGVPALIVSLTIVAFGTSAPELLIAVSAVHEGAPGLALGNVIGSNTANILLVLGVPALMSRLETGHTDTRKNYSFMISRRRFLRRCVFSGRLPGCTVLCCWPASLMLGDSFRVARHHRRTYKGAVSPPAEELAAVEAADPTCPGGGSRFSCCLALSGCRLGPSFWSAVRSISHCASAFPIPSSA